MNRPYSPPLHIGVYNHSTLVKDDEVAWWVAAVSKQLREHTAPAWGYPPPGVAFYGHAERLPAEHAAILGIVDSDGNAESAGYHSMLGRRVYGLVDVSQSERPSVTLSHEALEMFGNAYLDQRVPGPKEGMTYLVELADPCQRDEYSIETELLGEVRKVPVSDFVMPKWFGLPSILPHDARTTFLDGYELDPFEVAPGGYQITEDVRGRMVLMSLGDTRINRSVHSRTDRFRRGGGPAK